METNEIQNFIDEKISVASIVFLFHYKEFGLPSRTFLLKEHDAILQKLINCEGHFATYPNDTRIFLESRFYIELLERICLLIEDFCAISEGLCDDIRNLPQTLVKHKNPQNFLEKLNNEKWLKILKYSSIDSLPLSLEEKAFLNVFRNKNLEVLNNFVSLIKNFLELYWVSYTKYKHGNSLIYGFQHNNIGGEKFLVIPVAFNHKNVSESKAIIANHKIYLLWQQIFNTLYMITGDIIQRNIDYAETGGHPSSEQIIYFRTSDEERISLTQIINKCNSNMKRTSIVANVEVKIPLEVIQKHLELIKLANLGSFKSM
jgi:hypothetical protein